MKVTRLLRTAQRCGVLGAILWLASLRLLFAQPFYSALGPAVRITSPANHATFYAPVDIPILAYVPDSARVTNVEFYANTNDLGSGFSLGVATHPPGMVNLLYSGSPVVKLGSAYCFLWTNVPPGTYVLTAVAKGISLLSGQSRTSAPVNITVLPSQQMTTGPRVVSIVALDSIAIVGTNTWVWSGMTNPVPAWSNWPPAIWQSFTNWGPKDALFLVRCSGNTSDVFSVTYSISGTASNGVDYAELPGSVTIPAGQSHVLIPIVPIDNGPPYVPKTVILTLTPATNGPPPLYVLGKPTNAVALILHDWPRPLPFLLPDRSFHVNAAGPDGAWFSVQSSSDLENWSSVSTNQIFQGSIDFVDPDAPNNSSRFYRTLPLTNAPAN